MMNPSKYALSDPFTSWWHTGRRGVDVTWDRGFGRAVGEGQRSRVYVEQQMAPCGCTRGSERHKTRHGVVACGEGGERGAKLHELHTCARGRFRWGSLAELLEQVVRTAIDTLNVERRPIAKGLGVAPLSGALGRPNRCLAGTNSTPHARGSCHGRHGWREAVAGRKPSSSTTSRCVSCRRGRLRGDLIAETAQCPKKGRRPARRV